MSGQRDQPPIPGGDDQSLQNLFLQKRGHCVPGREVCPVAAILRYMSTRGPTEGPGHSSSTRMDDI